MSKCEFTSYVFGKPPIKGESMNQDQKDHLKKILDDTRELLMTKYVKGACEHDSELNKDYTASQLLDMAIEEALDQITYLLTLKDKMGE